MADARYILCRWKERSWPAKVLDGPKPSANHEGKKEFFLDVQILSLEEKIRVKSTEVERLEMSHIEDIASSLVTQEKVLTDPLGELMYRRSLRVALNVLNKGLGQSPESSSREHGTLQCPTEAASSPRSSVTSPLREDLSPGTGPQRRSRRDQAQQNLSGFPACKEDPKFKVDLKQGLRKSTTLQAGAGPQDNSGSEVHRQDQIVASKRGRSATHRSGRCQNVPAVAGPESEAGGCTAPSSPSRARARDDDLCARAEGHDPGLPSGSLTVLPVLERAGIQPAKRLCLDESQGPPTTQLDREPLGCVLSPGPSPGEYMTLRSAVASTDKPLRHPGTPAEETRNLCVRGGDTPEEGPLSSEESMEFPSTHAILDEDEEDEEPPRILLYHEPRSFEVGMLVWLKYQKYPFWPAVVKSVRRRDKKASVLFIERDMNPKGKGITVSLRRLKHFDCKEKQALLDKAKEDFNQAIGCCVSLITDYRVRLGCGSFTGSFLEYFAADISYPVRKSIQQDSAGTKFPQLSRGDPKEPEGDSPLGHRQPCRKVLPDRSRAARDRANWKLVEYIVKARGAESHLRAILTRGKPSRWLQTFLSSGQYVTCVETYLEDEEQLDLVVKYLQGVYSDMDGEALAPAHCDRIRFILDVLLPEAIICAIAAVDAVDYRTAEEKYIRGPSLGYREKEIFDNQLLEERKLRR
ncbi:PWWP domain-containing DNA repair factor 3A [Ctenodactylus gundi]